MRHYVRLLILCISVAGAILFLLLTVESLINFFSVSNPSWQVKIPFMVSVTGLFVMVYILFLFYYSNWSKKTKSYLEFLYKIERRILYEKYNRIFVNEELLCNMGHNPKQIKRLSQRDKRDIFNGGRS